MFCGFGGSDSRGPGPLAAGDIFLGGEGNDSVDTNIGTFNGGAGDDLVGSNFGTFFGEEGCDQVGADIPP